MEMNITFGFAMKIYKRIDYFQPYSIFYIEIKCKKTFKCLLAVFL